MTPVPVQNPQRSVRPVPPHRSVQRPPNPSTRPGHHTSPQVPHSFRGPPQHLGVFRPGPVFRATPFSKEVASVSGPSVALISDIPSVSVSDPAAAPILNNHASISVPVGANRCDSPAFVSGPTVASLPVIHAISGSNFDIHVPRSDIHVPESVIHVAPVSDTSVSVCISNEEEEKEERKSQQAKEKTQKTKEKTQQTKEDNIEDQTSLSQYDVSRFSASQLFECVNLPTSLPQYDKAEEEDNEELSEYDVSMFSALRG